MFDIGWGELVLIGIVALIAIGPKELPGALRTLGQWTGKIRRMAGEFQQQFQEAMREAEMADLKKEFDEAAEAAKRAAFDPIAEMRTEVETAQREIESAAALPAAAIPAPDAPPPPAMAPAETAPSVSPPAVPPNTAPDDASEQHAAPAARGDAA